MKAIISHDVDHISVWEHHNDLIIPKFIARKCIELISGYVSISEVAGRIKRIMINKWHNLEEIMKFNIENNIPATFFIGTSNGNGLKYSLRDADFWIKNIMKEGFDVGVHGIAFESPSLIQEEHDIFQHIVGHNTFGIRMHYLKQCDTTIDFLNKASYAFDSSVYRMSNPFKIGRLWEFPLHIYEGDILCANSRWQNQNLNQSKDTTKRLIESAVTNNIKYLTVLFHDRYFTDSFRTWKDWYIWIISYLKENDIKFINYTSAINELESSNEIEP